jgi:phage tail-like protein
MNEAVTVSHCADSWRRYPGETVSFYTRVQVAAPLPGFALRITLPAGLILDDYRALTDPEHPPPLITWDEGRNHLNWQVDRECAAGDRYEYQAVAHAEPTNEDRVLESRAVVSAQAEDRQAIWNEESVTVVVVAKGQYVQYLPAIYEDDELMGRFLMLFESFWAPIEKQIDSLPCYFDPRLTPPEFLPWLASWIDLVLDEQWPEERRRELLRSAVSLYRKRGTPGGLEDYLEIYTGTRPEVIEHRAQNFRLGPAGQLGQGIALGTDNIPHTFTVRLKLPLAEYRFGGVSTSLSGSGASSSARRERERHAFGEAQQELARRRKIEAIIEAQKPAHTRFNLQLEVDPEPTMRHARYET